MDRPADHRRPRRALGRARTRAVGAAVDRGGWLHECDATLARTGPARADPRSSARLSTPDLSVLVRGGF